MFLQYLLSMAHMHFLTSREKF